jgi:hypothetical protein
MTLDELRLAFRREADDIAAPYLWSNDDVDFWVNEAEVEACRRARLIVDSRTPDLCEISLLAGDEWIDIDARIISVRRVRLSGFAYPLVKKTRAEMDMALPGWEDHTGDPQAFVSDMDVTALRMYPTPTTAGTALLTVIREPKDPMVDDDDTPEIAPRYHAKLVHWAVHRAFAKKDTETLDENASLKALALFEQEFGPRRSAQSERFEFEQYDQDRLDGSY